MINSSKSKNIESIYPLSPVQQGMLFHTLYTPESGIYIEQYVFSIIGLLNIHIFQKAWEKVIERHAVLRTLFVWENQKKPLQIVLKIVDFSIDYQDWREKESKEKSQLLDRFLENDLCQPLDLGKPPLMRFTVIQLNDSSYQLIWSFHHIILDGWSVPIVLKELFDYYQALVAQKELSLAPAPLYRNYINWLEQQDLAEAETFWRQTLAGFLAPTPLVEDSSLKQPKRTIESYAEQSSCLSAAMTAALESTARQYGLTVNTILQGAWAILLSRYSGESDIVFGRTVSGRPPTLPRVESIVGLFINTLPLRVKVDEKSTGIEFLKQLQRLQIEQDAYAHSSLVDIHRWSEVAATSPLFEAITVFENLPLDPKLRESIPEIEIRDVQIGDKTNYPLTVTFMPGERLQINITYDAQRFSAELIKRMQVHLRNLLSGIVENPEQQLMSFTMLSELEKQQLLVDWNNNASDYPRDKCIHHLFEEQVARTPEAVALVYEGQSLTYRQLNEKANQLAHYLQGLGVKSETLVGIGLERSLEMVIGLLAILKAGGAYVPLDPTYPEERLAYILSDAQVAVLLTQEQWLSKLPASKARLVCLDKDWQTIVQESGSNPSSRVNPNNIAYIIYTSGSTGTPKGVMIEHNSLVNFAQSAVVSYQLNAQDNILQFASISFDAAAEEIYPSLVSGATITLRTQDMLGSITTFFQCCQEWKITVLDLPTAYWHQIVGELKEKKTNLNLPHSLRLVIIGGEAVSGEAVKAWQKIVKNNLPQLVNTYGPTEATVVATSSYLGRYQEARPIIEKLSIGRPIANTQIYILDKYLQPVPVGVGGELHIGGNGLARGYLNRPELTQTKFIAHPFSKEPKAQLYKTGDLCRYLADGNIEYLGRIDNQVKLRGFRIELGEIENILSQETSIREAAVVLGQEEENGNKKLVAYLVGNRIATAELRQKLKTKLPEYMIPSQFVWLEALPLTPNGKIDRRALPAPVPEQRLTEILQPQTPTQEILSHIWSEILKVPQIGRTDNFFELGGHSLLATQIISRIRHSFAVELSLRSLFESPTLEQLAAQIERTRLGGQSLTLTPIQAIESRENLPLSFAQERLWFLDQLEGGQSTVYNMPGAIALKGKLDREALKKSFAALIERHEVFRTAFVSQAGQPRQVIAPEIIWEIEEIDLQNLAGEAQRIHLQKLHSQEADTPFDLSQSPLMRGRLIQLEPDRFLLQITLHHIIFDGWSMEVLVREWSGFYRALAQGQPSPLPPLTIQYADFAVWQRRWLQGEVLQQQLDYWKKQLEDAPPLLELPTDYPRPAVQTFRGQTRDFYLSGELTAQLRALAQKAGATLFMTLFAALAVLLSRYSRQEDIVIGSPIANRHRQELEPLIGFFVNTLALRVRLEDNPSFEELLGQVKQTTLDAYSHQDLPFEKLVEELQVARSLSHPPLFQVMFVLQNTPPIPLQLPDLELQVVEGESTVAKFDLTLTIEEREQGLQGSWEYNGDLFAPQTIERLMGHWQNLLEGITVNPQAKISELTMLSAAERQQLLGEWNRTQRDYPRDKCIHHLFEEQVARTPEAVALVYEGQSLTYRQLNEKANQLAHYLQGLGVRPETLVGICLERSPEMVIGLLAILKAGGAYVPLDPVYPAERIAGILDDSQVVALLTQQQFKDRFTQVKIPILYLDEEALSIAEQSVTNLSVDVRSPNLAYVIYTSGSTGQPKGVLIPHSNIVRLFTATQAWFNFTEQDVWTLFHSTAFDFSVWEMWGALIYGGRLVIVPYLISRSPDSFYELLCQQQVTVLNQTPSAFRQLIQAEESCQAKTQDHLRLRLVIFGGEALELEGLRPWFDRHGDQFPQLVNMYGITETTVHVTYRPLSQADLGKKASLIGQTIPDLELYILDKHHHPVPIGVYGELYVGGAGLARGYLNRPELTIEKFIPHLFSDDPHARLYRTGDVARYLTNGDIDYLGRIDHQIKLRGFRIELGEIEHTLIQHPQIREVVVIVKEDCQGDKKLLAYLVGNPVATSELRSILKAKLPEYMVPTYFVWLEALPLTPNGKIDLRSLPSRQLPDFNPPTSYVPPRTSLEEQIAQVWTQFLQLEKIGIHDSFFELGGHSLLATQVVSRIQDNFDINLPLRSLFESPTIAELAQVIKNIKSQDNNVSITKIPKISREKKRLKITD